MKGKHLGILLLLLVVIGGASFFLQKGNNSSWSASSAGTGGKVINLPLNDVSKILVKTAEGELHLAKKDSGWTVAERGDYPADFTKISELLRKVWDLKTVQEVKVGPSQLARLGLVEPGQEGNSGVLVDFQDKDGKRLDAILLGKAYLKKAEGEMAALGNIPVGRYVRPLTANAKVSLVPESFESVLPAAATWLDHDFFKIADPLSIALAGTTEAQQWKLTRPQISADWQLAEPKAGEELDKNKLFPIGTAFSSASFVDVLPPETKPTDRGLDKPTVITIETSEHFTYTIKLGTISGSDYPLALTVTANFPKERTPAKDEKPEDKTKLDEAFKADLKRLEDKLAAEKKFEGRVYVVTKSSLEAILKDRSALLVDKKPEGAPAGAAAPAPGLPPGFPGGFPGLPGGLPQAVTPPVSVPTPAPVAPAPAPAPETPAAPAPAPAPAPTAPPPAPEAAAPEAAAPAPAAPEPAAPKP